MQIDLFNKLVKPILLYGSEIWGFGNLDIIERIQLKFFKYIFNLKKSTPTYMIYGEVGITPISVEIKNKTISYWTKLVNNSNVTDINTPKHLIKNVHAYTRAGVKK